MSGVERPNAEIAGAEDAILKRLLATPPDHKTKAKPGASPKKRGRPPLDKPSEKT
jgi:hypothetical protein